MRNGVSGDVLQTLWCTTRSGRIVNGSEVPAKSARNNSAVELYDRVYPGPELIPFTRLMSPKTT